MNRTYVLICITLASMLLLATHLSAMAEGRPPRFRLEKESSEKRRLEESRRKEPVTRAEQLIRDRDFAKRLNEKSFSAAELQKKIIFEQNSKIENTLDRIKRGERDSHYNDGAVFMNREKLLPEKPEGYYKEYVIRQERSAKVGPERLVIGKSGEVYYTSNHYASFSREK